MTAETAPSQAGAAPGGPAEPEPARPSLSQRIDHMTRYGIWVVVGTRILLQDRRLHASVIAGAIGTYALFSVFKNNQARPMRRVAHWYSVQGEVKDMKVVVREAREALKPGEG